MCVQFRFLPYTEKKKPELLKRTQKLTFLIVEAFGFFWELKHAGIPFERQKVYPLNYKGDYIGAYFADIVVDNKIILELKAVQALHENMIAQVINYFKLSKIQVGYLINFNGMRVDRLKLRCGKAAVCVPAGVSRGALFKYCIDQFFLILWSMRGAYKWCPLWKRNIYGM